MSGQVSRGSIGADQPDERAGVARLCSPVTPFPEVRMIRKALFLPLILFVHFPRNPATLGCWLQLILGTLAGVTALVEGVPAGGLC